MHLTTFTLPLLPILNLAAAQSVIVTVSAGVTTTFTLPGWLYPLSAMSTVTGLPFTTTTTYMPASSSTSPGSAASSATVSTTTALPPAVSSYISSLMSIMTQTSASASSTSTSTAGISSTTTGTATSTVYGTPVTFSTSTTTAGPSGTYTMTVVVLGGNITTTMYVAPTNTTGTPSQFTGGAAKDGVVRLAVAGAAMALGLGLL